MFRIRRAAAAAGKSRRGGSPAGTDPSQLENGRRRG